MVYESNACISSEVQILLLACVKGVSDLRLVVIVFPWCISLFSLINFCVHDLAVHVLNTTFLRFCWKENPGIQWWIIFTGAGDCFKVNIYFWFWLNKTVQFFKRIFWQKYTPISIWENGQCLWLNRILIILDKLKNRHLHECFLSPLNLIEWLCVVIYAYQEAEKKRQEDETREKEHKEERMKLQWKMEEEQLHLVEDQRTSQKALEEQLAEEKTKQEEAERKFKVNKISSLCQYQEVFGRETSA